MSPFISPLILTFFLPDVVDIDHANLDDPGLIAFSFGDDLGHHAPAKQAAESTTATTALFPRAFLIIFVLFRGFLDGLVERGPSAFIVAVGFNRQVASLDRPPNVLTVQLALEDFEVGRDGERGLFRLAALPQGVD